MKHCNYDAIDALYEEIDNLQLEVADLEEDNKYLGEAHRLMTEMAYAFRDADADGFAEFAGREPSVNEYVPVREMLSGGSGE